MRITHRHSTAAALAALTLLSACGSEPEAPPEPAPVETVTPVEAPPAPPPPEPPVANVVEAAPVEEIAPDQQVLEDADATGMTARVDREATGTEDATQSGEQIAE